MLNLNKDTLYPVLPLRDIVVFPHMIVPLFVGREKSVRALEDVMKEDKQILLVTQRNAAQETYASSQADFEFARQSLAASTAKAWFTATQLSLQAGIAMAPRGIGAFFMMQITGRLTATVDPRKLLTAGMIIGGVTTLWLAGLNLQAGYWDVFWPQLIQGIGMSMLFVPLTMVAMDAIPRERMGNATSLFNLMRNIGGSIGIAITGTMLARNSQATTAVLGSNVTMYDPATQLRFAQLKAAFMAAGADAVTASDRAYAALFGMVQRQASMVTFVGIFQLLAIMFVALVPLVLIMKRPRGAPPVAAH